MRIQTVTMLMVFAAAGTALAWGPDGHRAVCEIAYLHLDKAHQKEVNRLATHMQTPGPLKKYTSFAQGCTFPDDVRDPIPAFARFKQYTPWHFLNVPRTTTTITSDAGCNDDCVLHGIDFHTAKIKDPSVSDQDRAEALLYLGHWVGDIHQPLHVSFEDDHGGGTIKPIHGIYTSSSLHSVWDSGIIKNDEKQNGWKALAVRLSHKITADEASQWPGGTPVEWANESFQITIQPDVQYCKESGGTCGALTAKGRTLQQAYQDEYQPTVEKRLEQAGIRLADIIQKNLPVH